MHVFQAIFVTLTYREERERQYITDFKYKNS